MSQFDLIVVLGAKTDTSTWKFPEQLYRCLDRAAELCEQAKAPLIALSGKWTINYDYTGEKQPSRECDMMADYLQAKGFPEDKLVLEGESKDTISNLYYIKNQILIPQAMHKIIFVVASYRVPRLEFLTKRILGPDYECVFEEIEAEPEPGQNEKVVIAAQKLFLQPMKDGDDSWLADKFYDGWIYKHGGKLAAKRANKQ